MKTAALSFGDPMHPTNVCRSLLRVLKVYIWRGCRGCKRALELVSWVRKEKPGLNVEVVDVSANDRSDQDSVFAVPAYVYRSRAVFLGNPSQRELERWLDTL